MENVVPCGVKERSKEEGNKERRRRRQRDEMYLHSGEMSGTLSEAVRCVNKKTGKGFGKH